MKLILVIFTVLVTASYSVADDDDPVTYRLIELQKPEKYTLHMEFKKDIFEGTSTEFNGTLVIDFKVTRTIKSIQFHAPVTLKSMEFIDNKTFPVAIESESYDSLTHIYTITAQENLNYTHNYTLNIEYSSNIETDEMVGVYRGSYIDGDGAEQFFIATHFKPVYARFAFPCFDEPKMKAIFLLSITYPKGLTALSNTVQDGDTVTVDDDYEVVTFKETPVMSTHLVGFILSKLTCSEGANLTNNIPYRVCSVQEFVEERSVALELAPFFMKRMENITALNYSDHLLGKLDQVAIPGYTSKYMENWGLINYRKSSLLHNSKESSVAYRNVVMDMFLQLAHSWFGDLETVDWWDYSFLNLGFSRFYQYHAGAQIDALKKWDLEKQFVIDQLHPSLILDALSDTSALSYPVMRPAEVLTKFNALAYSKSASIFRMAQYLIGAEAFEKGVRYFLPIYNGSNIEPIYVWNKLEEFLPREYLPKRENLNGAMTGWSEKAGYPLVTVHLRGDDIILTQDRFLYSGEEDYTEWFIPITYTLSQDFDKFENTTVKDWLLPETSHTIYDILKENEWIILNNQQIGYYRVNYADDLWQRIKELLFTNHTSIHVLNRAQIVDDLLNLGRAKILNYSYAFDIVSYLKEETDYYPWQSAINNFNYILTLFGQDSTLGTEISKMVLDLLQNVYKSISFDNIDPDDLVYILKLLSVSNMACKLGDESCISTVKHIFAEHKSKSNIDKNLRGVVYCNALRYSDDDVSDWNFLWDIFQDETLESEREILIAALGCTKNDTLLKYFLDQSINSSSTISLDDLPNVWLAVYSGNPVGVDAAFDYLYENYSKLSSYYSSATSILISVIERFTRDDQMKKLEALITSGNLESSVRAVAQSALTAAKERMQWLESIEADLLTYFDVPVVIDTTTTQKSSSTTGGADINNISFIKVIVVVAFNYLFLCLM